jgi:SnoaL-like domain
MQQVSNSRELVLSYIKALDSQNFKAASSYLSESVRILGPGGETFSKPNDFVEMLSKYHGRYDIKKVFSDGDDICLIYDYKTPVGKAVMCSWYQVRNGKISWIQTIFDPSQFAPPTKEN